MNRIFRKTYYFVPTIPYLYYKNTTKKEEPYFNEEEIKKHNTQNDAWVSYKGKVYDITSFINIHPGGSEKITTALGGPLEPHWNIYQQHYNKEVLELLHEYEIGKTDKYTYDDPYINDPNRSEDLNVHKNKPFNGECNLKKLRENYITPIENTFIRNHHPVPLVDIKNYVLNVNGIKMNMDEIKKFEHIDIVSTIQCAGNRRKEFDKINSTLGLPWDSGAISNSKWTGISLKELFIHNNMIEGNENKFVHLNGIDTPFDCSISMKKIIDNEVILAFKMNDQELVRDHGYPLRAIVLGFSGAKNIKWLNEIVISDEESTSIWQKGIAYKGLPNYVTNIKDIEELDLKNIPTIESLPVQSFICDVEDIDESECLVRGIAYSGDGKNIIRVDVSNNNGDSWQSAKLLEGSDQEKNKSWAWTFWEIKLPITKGKVLCRATDSSYNTQPENIKNIWNLRGILNNSIDEYECIYY